MSETPRPVPVESPRRPRSRAGWLAVPAVLVAVAVGALLWADVGWPWSSPSLERAESRIAAGRYDAAAAEARRLLRDRPDDPKALWTLARARAGAGDLAGSVETLRRIPDWSARKPEALFFEGSALRSLVRGREAERALLDCIARGTPRVAGARVELLALYAMQERFDDFKANFWAVYPLLGPEDRLAVLTMRMRLEFEQVEPEVNAAELARMVESDPSDAHALAGLAATRVHAQDLPGAADLYERAVALRPDDPGLRERQLDVLHRLGRMDDLRQALSGRPPGWDDRPGTQRSLGIVAQADGDSESAAAAFARARDLEPHEPEHRHRLSQVMAALGRREEAAAEAAERDRLRRGREELLKAWAGYADAYESRPESLGRELLAGMARACRAAGLTREAEVWANEADRVEPDGRGTGGGDAADSAAP